MARSWDSYADHAERGPLPFLLVTASLMILGTVILGGTAYLLGWVGEGAQVYRDEFGPKAAMLKYGWFRDAAAQLEKKRADIQVYETRMSRMAEDYKGTPRVKWARDDREQYNVWSSEVAGIKASYNGLAAEYNAAMQKVNWRYASGGSEGPALARDYAAYETK